METEKYKKKKNTYKRFVHFFMNKMKLYRLVYDTKKKDYKKQSQVVKPQTDKPVIENLSINKESSILK